MQLTMKKMGAAAVAAALALCIAPAMAMIAPGQAHAATKSANITKLYNEGDLDIDIETTKITKKEQPDGSHRVNLVTYNGKAKKPKVEVRVYDPTYEGKRTDKYWDSEEKKIVTETYTTHYRPLKAVNITGKTAKEAKKLIKKAKADVTIEYKNNVEAGVAQVIVKGAKNAKGKSGVKYTGTVYTTFTINLAPVKTVKVGAAKKALKVKWSKVKGADGYQISVRDKEAGETVKTMLVSGKKKAATVKGLKSKRTYEVTVQAYKSNVKSAYKTTNSARYDEKWETVTDEGGWVDEKLVSYKTLTYTGSYERIGTYWGDESPVKAKKTK